MIPVIIALTIIVFILMRMLPGDPATIMLGSTQSSDPDFVARFRADYGFDKPIVIQYFIWFGKLATGDLGKSIFMREEVTRLLINRLPVTLMLSALASIIVIFFGLLVGVLLAALSSSGKYKIADRFFSAVPIALLSIPDFALGLFLIYFFSIVLKLLPPVGFRSVTETNILDILKHMILPSLTLASASTAATIRIVRSSVIEVIREDYIIAARARGLSSFHVLFHHVLKNSILPVVTNTGIMFGSMLGGAVIVETIFALPGIGKLMIDAILMRDYPVIQGGILVIVLSYLIINLLVDIDPRIKYN